jgi:hypothetical protein
MSTTREQLQRSLAFQDPAALLLILQAAEVDPRGAESSPDLAARIADAIWWNYSTPLGYVTERSSLEDIVRHLARKLGVADRVDPDSPVWDQVAALTSALVAEVTDSGVPFDRLDPAAQERLRSSWWPPIGLGTGAGGAFATRWGSARVLALLRSPIGRLLPYLPGVGPWVGGARTALSAVHLVSGPLGIALAVLSVNAALGTNYRRLVPLVLGVGALRPSPVEDATVVEPSPESAPPAEA